MKKQPKTYMFYIGIIIFVIGLLLKFLIPESEGAMQSAPFVLTGFGAGIIGVGAAGIFRKKVFDKNPEKAKKYEIAEKDERNIRLREKAGIASWYSTLFVLAILSLVLLILDYALPCFLIIAAMFIHIISLFVYIIIYNKKI